MQRLFQFSKTSWSDRFVSPEGGRGVRPNLRNKSVRSCRYRECCRRPAIYCLGPSNNAASKPGCSIMPPPEVTAAAMPTIRTRSTQSSEHASPAAMNSASCAPRAVVIEIYDNAIPSSIRLRPFHATVTSRQAETKFITKDAFACDMACGQAIVAPFSTRRDIAERGRASKLRWALHSRPSRCRAIIQRFGGRDAASSERSCGSDTLRDAACQRRKPFPRPRIVIANDIRRRWSSSTHRAGGRPLHRKRWMRSDPVVGRQCDAIERAKDVGPAARIPLKAPSAAADGLARACPHEIGDREIGFVAP